MAEPTASAGNRSDGGDRSCSNASIAENCVLQRLPGETPINASIYRFADRSYARNMSSDGNVLDQIPDLPDQLEQPKASQSPPPSSFRISFVGLLFAIIVSSLDQNIVATALPHIA